LIPALTGWANLWRAYDAEDGMGDKASAIELAMYGGEGLTPEGASYRQCAEGRVSGEWERAGPVFSGAFAEAFGVVFGIVIVGGEEVEVFWAF